MYPELTGKYALITGAARGFGRAIAIRLALEGVWVAVNYRRSKSDALAVVEEIVSGGGNAFAVRADVGDPESLDRLFGEIGDRFGGLDIVVSNAAFGIPGPLMHATPKYWETTLSASARAFLDIAQRAAPMMDGWGRMISLTSAGGQRVLSDYGLMGAAKGALESLTRGLAVELAPRGILVNGILAGVSDTRSLRSLSNAEDLLRMAEERTPAGRLVTPEDIADVAAFLASDQARMICGHLLVVDGGFGVVV